MSKYPYIAEILKQESTVDIEQQAEDLTNDMKTILAQMLTSIKENNARQKKALEENEKREDKRDADEKERRLSPDGTTAAEEAEKLRENQKRTKEEILAYKQNLKNLDANRKNKTTDDGLRGSKLQQFLGTQGKETKPVSNAQQSLQQQQQRQKDVKFFKDHDARLARAKGAEEKRKLQSAKEKAEGALRSTFDANQKIAEKEMAQFQADEKKRKRESDIAQVKTIQGKREKQAGKTRAAIAEAKYGNKNASEDSEDIFWFNRVIKIV